LSDLITVYVQEEYGYRHWVWETGFTAEELTTWWQNLDSVMRFFFHTMETLPGTLHESVAAPREFYLEHFNEEGVEEWYEGLRKPTYFEATRSTEEGDDSTIWYAHFHCDDDSHLVNSEGERFVHAGFVTEDMEEDHPTVVANAAISDQAMMEHTKKMALEHAEGGSSEDSSA